MSDFLRRYLAGSGSAVSGLLLPGSHPRRHSVPVITLRTLLRPNLHTVPERHRVESPELTAPPRRPSPFCRGSFAPGKRCGIGSR